MQYLAEQEWDLKYRSDRGEPRYIVDYMKSNYQVPIMTNSESILQFGNNAYAKPATALVILRESILGRELFDLAFREYANKWKFKRPTPYDFFRTMEEASGTDLDWFWRGWFYSTDHVDIALEKVFKASLDTLDPKKKILKKIDQIFTTSRLLSTMRRTYRLVSGKELRKDPNFLIFTMNMMNLHQVKER